jgi:hypothetical protein
MMNRLSVAILLFCSASLLAAETADFTLKWQAEQAQETDPILRWRAEQKKSAQQPPPPRPNTMYERKSVQPLGSVDKAYRQRYKHPNFSSFDSDDSHFKG